MEDLTERRTGPAGHVLVTMLVALSLAAFLNAGSLAATARNLPVDTWFRPVALPLAEAVETASRWVLLDRPRAGLDAALGRSADRELASAATTSTTLLAAGSAASTTTTIPAPARVPTAGNPLRLWIIGDSLVQVPGQVLVNLAAESGLIDPTLDFRLVSGLTRDDFFDWPAHIAETIPALRPEAVVVMFGGNDGQSVVVDGKTLEKWTPEWLEWYQPRVDEAMDLLAGGGRRIYWVGLPVMRNATFSEHVSWLNEIYAEEASRHDGVVFVNTFRLFVDEAGRYAEYLPDESGSLRLMRASDGSHFTAAGGARLADHLLELIGEAFGL